jgi:hypothetical protein
MSSNGPNELHLASPEDSQGQRIRDRLAEGDLIHATRIWDQSIRQLRNGKTLVGGSTSDSGGSVNSTQINDLVKGIGIDRPLAAGLTEEEQAKQEVAKGQAAGFALAEGLVSEVDRQLESYITSLKTEQERAKATCNLIQGIKEADPDDVQPASTARLSKYTCPDSHQSVNLLAETVVNDLFKIVRNNESSLWWESNTLTALTAYAAPQKDPADVDTIAHDFARRSNSDIPPLAGQGTNDHDFTASYDAQNNTVTFTAKPNRDWITD